MLAKCYGLCYTVSMEFIGYENKTICVAVSGGVDSAVLLHKLKALSDGGSVSLCAVHCEHGIRGEESVADMGFVKALCKCYEIPLYVFRANCPALAKERGVSLETAARQFRYEAFESLLKEGKADYIALAHHSGDEAETVLFRLARGTALSGVGAMKEENGRYLRPLLKQTKEEILAYAEKHRLFWREDKTNAEALATRNKLRLTVLPALEEAVPGAGKNLSNFAFRAREDDDCLYALSEALITKKAPAFAGDSGYRVAFCEKKPLFTRACLTVLKGMGVQRDYTREQLDGLFRLQGLQTGAKATVIDGVWAVKQYGELAFFKEEARGNGEEIPFGFGAFRLGRYEFTVSKTPTGKDDELVLDADKICKNAVFRFKRQGDSFEKFGGGRKSLKRYLVDKKIPSAERVELVVLACEGEALAVLGVEISEKVKVMDETKEKAYLSARKITEEEYGDASKR